MVKVSKQNGDEVVIYVQTLASQGTISSTLLLMKGLISDLFTIRIHYPLLFCFLHHSRMFLRKPEARKSQKYGQHSCLFHVPR